VLLWAVLRTGEKKKTSVSLQRKKPWMLIRKGGNAHFLGLINKLGKKQEGGVTRRREDGGRQAEVGRHEKKKFIVRLRRGRHLKVFSNAKKRLWGKPGGETDRYG